MTGWTRDRWAAYTDRMLAALDPYRSPGGARIDLPGPASRNGRDSDALEGFARTFLAVGFRVAGERGADPTGLLDRYAEGLAAGTDPAHPEAWPRPDRVDQAKVEAASIALVLQLTRPWLWDRLDDGVRARTLDWLGAVVGGHYPPINWVWFQVMVESFLREAGGEWSRADVEADLAVHAGLRRAGGWITDRADQRAYDHYVGWALHFYPTLWTELFDVTSGPDPLCSPALAEQWRDDLRDYLDDAVLLVGADGSPLVQGRSLTYRYAAAAPFWLGGWTGTLDPGLARNAASAVLGHFADRAPHPLPLGWHGEWTAIRQDYSGPASPYWASKGLLGLALPDDHPVWTAAERPLPAESGDHARVLRTPGWLVSVHDGITTVVNHGTDHAAPGAVSADSPLYARLGYSTATVPPLAGPDLDSPLDNAVVLLDDDGRASHRTGFETLCLDDDGTALIGVSRGPVRWMDTSGFDDDFGFGRTGPTVDGPVLTVASAVRDGVEVRIARVEPGGPPAPGPLRIGGWPLSAEDPQVRGAVARTDELVSAVVALHGLDRSGCTVETGVSPLGAVTAVPWATTDDPPEPGRTVAAMVVLDRDAGGGGAVPVAPEVEVDAEGVHITWPCGPTTRLRMPARVQAPATP